MDEGVTGEGDVLGDADFQCFIKLGKTGAKLGLAGITRNGEVTTPETTGNVVPVKRPCRSFLTGRG